MPAKRTRAKSSKRKVKASAKNPVRRVKAKAGGKAKPKAGRARNVVRAAAARSAKGKKTAGARNVVRAKPVRASKPARNAVVERPVQLELGGAIPPPEEGITEVSGVWGTVRVNEADPDAEVKEIFGHYDRDGSGQIDAKEFARVCEALGMELEEHELTVALLDVDGDRDGRINRDEFLRWWKGMRA